MRFAILSLIAAGALAASAGSADARPPRYGGGYGGYSNYGGYNRGYSNYGNWNRGYSNYGNWNRGYNSGFGVTIGGARGVITIGSGNVYPGFGYGYGAYPRPYYGGWNGFYPRW